jgi:hypothetical protein
MFDAGLSEIRNVSTILLVFLDNEELSHVTCLLVLVTKPCPIKAEMEVIESWKTWPRYSLCDWHFC